MNSGWVDEQMDGWIDEQMLDIWTLDEWISGWTDGWIDG